LRGNGVTQPSVEIFFLIKFFLYYYRHTLIQLLQMADAVAPRPRSRGGGAGRSATAVLALLLGCVAVVALLGRTEPRGAALAERVPMSAPARADEASWKSTVLGLFGTFKAASGAGIDLVNPVDKDSFRGGGGGRIGPYRAPASSTPEGEVRVFVRARVCVRTSTY
jgi:hypothetical protein